MLGKFTQTDFVANATGNGGGYGISVPVGNLSYGVWIGLKLVNAYDAFNGPKYWTDQANKYLKSGDYGYVRNKFPWAHQPDTNPLQTNVFTLALTIIQFFLTKNTQLSVHLHVDC